MPLRRLILLAAIALGVVAGPVTSSGLGTQAAEARTGKAEKGKTASGKTSKASKSRAAKARKAKASKRKARVTRSKKRGKIKVCKPVKGAKGKRKRTRCTFVRTFSGHGVAAADLRTAPLERPSGDVWVHAENLGEEARVNIYRPDGAYDEEALARLDDIFRCKRTHEVRALDPRLYEQLSRMQDHFGGARATIVSGFRFAERSSSRHFHASAIDIRIEGVGVRDMYAYAQGLDAGGMGIGVYPHSGFVHLDYRASGEPSYRWTDLSGRSSKARKGKAAKRGKAPGRTARAKRPTS